MAPLTREQLIQLASAFGPSLIQGIGQGGQTSADRALTEQDRARQAEQELYNRRMGARAGLAGFYQNQLNRDITAAGDVAAQSPLGAEQALARQMARQRAGGMAAAQYRSPTGMSPAASALSAQQPNFLAPFGGAEFQATVSPEATARSIAERRKALGAIDPNFQFGSMGDYGLPDLGAEVSQYQGDVRSRRQASEMDLQRLLTEQMREASAAQIPGATSATAGAGAGTTTSPKKPSTLRRVLGAALPVAAAFIPGVGPVASALIQAGAGAAGSAIAGGGVKGALTGAAMGGLGAATGGLGSAAARMGAGGAKEGLGSFVQRAILNPRALTQIAGGAMGGDAGMAAQLASLGMGRTPGAARPTFDTSFEQQGLPAGMLPAGGTSAGMTTSPGAAPFDTSFERQGLPSGLLPGGGTLTTALPDLPRRGGRASQPPPPAELPMDLRRALEQSMSRADRQRLPVGTLTDPGLQETFGPAAGAYKMFGGPEEPKTTGDIVGDLAGAGTLAALLYGAGFGPVTGAATAPATGARVTGILQRLLGGAQQGRKALPGRGTPSALPGAPSRLSLPGTQEIPLPNGVLQRSVGQRGIRLPGGGILQR